MPYWQKYCRPYLGRVLFKNMEWSVCLIRLGLTGEVGMLQRSPMSFRPMQHWASLLMAAYGYWGRLKYRRMHSRQTSCNYDGSQYADRGLRASCFLNLGAILWFCRGHADSGVRSADSQPCPSVLVLLRSILMSWMWIGPAPDWDFNRQIRHHVHTVQLSGSLATQFSGKKSDLRCLQAHFYGDDSPSRFQQGL